MNRNPLVSVCIPVYNAQDYLSEAITSVLQQDYENIEIIVVDNQSSDNSFTVMQSFCKKIEAFRNDVNIGMAGNWNECIRRSKGEFIKILPADDYIYNSCISEQVNKFLSSCEYLSIVSSSRDLIAESGRHLMHLSHKKLELKDSYSKREIIKMCFLSGTNIIGEPGAVLLRKSTVDLVGDFRQSAGYAVDLDYWIRMMDYGRFGFIVNPQAVFRLNKNSDSVKVIGRQAVDVLSLFAKFKDDGHQYIPFGYYVFAHFMVRLKVIARLLVYKIFF